MLRTLYIFIFYFIELRYLYYSIQREKNIPFSDLIVNYTRIKMLLRILCLLVISSSLLVNCLAPVPPVYRKAVMALKLYRSYASHNPLVYSLLNILIHHKYAKIFTSDQAIEMALNDIKELDKKTGKNNEGLLREIIYGKSCKTNDNNCLNRNGKKPANISPELTQRITLNLDKIFGDDDGSSNNDDTSAADTSNQITNK